MPDAINNRPRGRRKSLTLTQDSDGSTIHISAVQRVRFKIRLVTTKDEFITALNTPRLHVIYDGHARYGRGPCFGDVSRGDNCSDPGEDWSEGTDRRKYGLFRMGYPYVAVPVKEVTKHGYTANPVPGSVRLRRRDCHPGIPLGRLRRFALDELDRSGAFADHVSAPQPADARFWGFDRYEDGHVRRFVVLYAGWSATTSSPADVGAADLECRVFCHFGCSTFKHNYRVVRFMKGWRRTDTDYFAYWTRRSVYGDISGFWLYHILTYPVENAFQPWRPSLRYALRKTNNDLRRQRRRYRII